jgi:tetratricopeptide (TPR) repeat protein
LSPREKEALQRPHTGGEAYEFYLRGRQYLPRMSEGDLKRSREMFEKAIELDASYSPAYAGLAMVHATLYEWFGSKAEDCFAAETSSQRALELTPELAEAHVALGFALTLARRYDEAAEEFEEAIRLAPNLFDPYFYYARACFASGRFEQAVEMFRNAAVARPEDYQSALLLSLPLRVLGRDEESREASREGLRRAERSLMFNPRDVRALSLGSCALYDIDSERALEWSRRALDLAPEDMSTLVNAACLHAKLGRKEDAMGFIEGVFARGWGKRDWIEHDPDYEILRDDPRFKKLLTALK